MVYYLLVHILLVPTGKILGSGGGGGEILGSHPEKIPAESHSKRALWLPQQQLIMEQHNTNTHQWKYSYYIKQSQWLEIMVIVFLHSTL